MCSKQDYIVIASILLDEKERAEAAFGDASTEVTDALDAVTERIATHFASKSEAFDRKRFLLHAKTPYS